jgi:hypothetical protein
VSLVALLVGVFLLDAADATAIEHETPTNQVTVIVQFGDGRLITRRVTFADDAISALDALLTTGLDVVTGFGGAAVCRIEDQGCPADDCFCSSSFWSLWLLEDGQWESATTGANEVQLSNGHVSGWHWGDFSPPISLTAPEMAAYSALDWLSRQQGTDGGFGYSGPAGESDPGPTLDAILGGAAANADPASWRNEAGLSPLDYLAGQVITYTDQSAAAAGKMALGIIAADGDVCDFAGQDLIAKVNSYYDTATGQYGSSNWDQALSILALQAAKETVPISATLQLKSTQSIDGGWAFSPPYDVEVDSTALVLQALVAASEPLTSTTVLSATIYLHSMQTTDGGFPGFSGDTSASSTSLGVQGLIAIDQNPLSATWTVSDTTPIAALLALQSPEGGFAGFFGPNDLQSTAQAIPALVGRPLPLLGRRVAVHEALGWIRGQQNADGGFPGFAEGSDPGATLDAAFAFAADAVNPDSVETGGLSPFDYLETQVVTYTVSTAATAKLILSVVAGERDPRAFGGVDLVDQLTQAYQTTGQYGASATDQAWALLALDATRTTIPQAAVAWLLGQQQPGGGWESAAGWGTDSNTTGLALQALEAAGVAPDSTGIISATQYLRSLQNNDGGFPYTKPSPYGTDTDTNSTAYAIQGLMAAGQVVDGPTWTRHLTETTAITLTLRSPVDRLLELQNPSGAFCYQDAFPGDNRLATYQAVPALLGQVQPLRRQEVSIYLPLVSKAAAFYRSK